LVPKALAVLTTEISRLPRCPPLARLDHLFGLRQLLGNDLAVVIHLIARLGEKYLFPHLLKQGDEATLIKEGKHILAAYTMQPAADYDYLEVAVHIATESSTGTNIEVCTTDDFTKDLDAMVYEIDQAKGIMKAAYPSDLFDRNVTDGRTMVVSFLTLAIGNNQGMGDVANLQMQDFHVPPRMLQLFDGPSKDISDMWRALGRSLVDDGYIAGTIIKPKLGLRPEPFVEAAYQFWLGGDFIKNDEPQGNQVFCPMKKVIPLVVDTMKRAQDEVGQAKLFSANITADDHYEMLARADCVLEAFGPDADKAGADPIEYAKEHKEFARAFESFPGDADKIFPGWREKLGVHKQGVRNS